jgi:hypothetical protein
VVEVFSSAPFRWWVSGGHALDLHVGRTWRRHGDIDVGVVRCELGAVHGFLADWDIHVAAAGQLTPWHGEPLDAARHQNNLWCRHSPGDPWTIDVTIGDGSDDHWTYRRDPSLQVPWDLAVLRTAERVPYLAPELQLLLKSTRPRPKDDADAAQVIPDLGAGGRELLDRMLDPDHPWRRLLA